MTPFEEHLLQTFYPELLAWTTECVATYVLHTPAQKPIFFKKMTDEILEHAMQHAQSIAVYAVKTDGSVDDVTEGWTRVFEKHKSARSAVDTLLATWKAKVPAHIATYELKTDGTTMCYFPSPNHDVLRRIDRVRDIRRLTVLAIHKSGTIEDMTTFWMPLFEEYVAIRSKELK
jgi:hypothetical protein